MEEWRPIVNFPGYWVSSYGRVRGPHDHILAQVRNQQGINYVGLMRDGSQHKRSVAVLVAEAFLPDPMPKAFDTPIHLDGNKANSRIENLMWRPRWFAVKYHQQFHNGQRGFDKPIQETNSGEIFKTSWDAAIRFGLIDRDILTATLNNTYVWPTYQYFRVI